MAKSNYYRAKRDVSVPRVVSKTGEGDSATYETTGENYPAGSIVPAKGMLPVHAEALENGELDHLLEPVSDEEAEQYGAYAGEPEFGIYIAEHEAEAHALRQYGHHVVPRDQALEVLSRSADYHADYQQQVKEAGADRRPILEAMAQEDARVPDELLLGAETQTGLPHNRGDAEENGLEGRDDAVENPRQPRTAETRPAPGAENPHSGEEGESDSDSDSSSDEDGEE